MLLTPAVSAREGYVATATASQRFRHWRRRRPFWGGLLLLLSGLAMFFSANLTLGDLKVHFGQEGYLSYLLPAIMLLCGALIWATPAQRVFYAVVGLLTALYSLIGLNLGGFGAGMLLGIVGGALAVAWTPARPSPGPATPAAEDDAVPFDRPAGDHGILPGLPDDRDGGGAHRTLLVVTLVPLLVTGGLVLAGGPAPARADDCPEGLPSRPAAERSRTAAPRSTPPRPRRTTRSTASPKPSASSTTTSPDGTGNPIVDGFHDFVEGVGDLLGIGDDKTPTPSPSPSSPAPGPSPSPSAPSRPPTTSRAPEPRNDDIPCLGPRVHKLAGPDDVPTVAVRPGVLETKSLTMYDSTYDGVVTLRTAKGPVEALKFSMRRAVNKPFSLTVPEAGGRDTVITSRELATDGDVRFYTPKFVGKLFGLIPVTFTPESPPPLTLPVLWFTDVTIDLAFVRCDTLTADPLDVGAPA
jgi:hypothetical protein